MIMLPVVGVYVTMIVAGEGCTVRSVAAKCIMSTMRVMRMIGIPRMVAQAQQRHDYEASSTKCEAKRIRTHISPQRPGKGGHMALPSPL
jgi:hypothetical protein